MKVVKSKTLGYCHGVASTLQKAQYCIDLAKHSNRKAYSIGTLIHNPDVVKSFSDQGLEVIPDSDCQAGIALIRAHGIADKVRNEFAEKGFELIDASCVNILHTKQVIKNDSSQGRRIVLLGIPSHAETKCLIGTEGCECILVSSENDLKALFENVPADEKITLVTQTTFPQVQYEKLSNAILKYYADCKIGSRLCPDCIKRKKDGLELASEVDAVVVVGGKNSENTKDLASFISGSGKPVYLFENVNDFTSQTDRALGKFKSVGVCSGTSTPIEIIDAICEHLVGLDCNN